jgi:hypothetical protein
MEINTAAALISFAKKLEEDSAGFYADLARSQPLGSELFLSFVKGNTKNILDIERAYYEVISDAIEGCFAFNLDPKKYSIDALLDRNGTYSQVILRSIALEDHLIHFYYAAAEQSQLILGNVPQVFKMVAKDRTRRVTKLQSISR